MIAFCLPKKSNWYCIVSQIMTFICLPKPSTQVTQVPRAHLEYMQLAILPLEASSGAVGREALTVRPEPVQIAIKNVAPKLSQGVIHWKKKACKITFK